jgi:GGDEF domain-containing protein
MPAPYSEDSPFRSGVLPETHVLLAGQDLLTGLSSRAGLDAQYRLAVARARRSGARFAVGSVLVEVDPAAPPDEVFGHDLHVVETARKLRSGLRETDVIARVAETRFAFIAEEVGAAGAAAIVERLSRVLGSRVGVALWESQEQTLATLLRAAEEAPGGALPAEALALAAANSESFASPATLAVIAPPRSFVRQLVRRVLGWLALLALLALAVSAVPSAWRNRWLAVDDAALHAWRAVQSRVLHGVPAAPDAEPRVERRP